MEGTDLAAIMDGEDPPQQREVHYGGMYNRFFIRTDDYVLIGDNQGNERHMYDLRQDPHELFNIEPKNKGLGGALPAPARAGRRAAALLRVGDRGDAGGDGDGAQQFHRCQSLVEKDGGEERGDHDAALPAWRPPGRRERAEAPPTPSGSAEGRGRGQRAAGAEIRSRADYGWKEESAGSDDERQVGN